jgi:hypothetical protein
MIKKKAKALSKVSAFSSRKKKRKLQSKLVPRNRKDLQLKDYLAEEHPELGLPLDGAKFGRTGAAKRAEQT